MVINHNISSLNTLNKLNSNTKATQNSLEKLSSGLRINKAGDDAAGLAISQKMLAQINGLDQSSKNAQDGISLIQTAEGSLNETQSILQRMNTLATQSASDTNTDADRAAMQTEVDQLKQEIDRIGNTTNFNTKNLLDGSSGVLATSNNANVVNISGTADTQQGSVVLTAETLAVRASVVDDSSASLTTANDALGSASAITINGTSFSFTGSQTVNDALAAINDKSGTTGVQAQWAAGTGFTLTSTTAGSAHQITTSGGTGMFADEGSAATTTNGVDATVTGYSGGYTAVGNKVTFTGGNQKGLTFTVAGTAAATITVGTNNSLKLQIGAAAGQTMSIGINDMRASALGISGVDLSTQTSASTAITTIQDAINTVSTQRATLGAYQNRLEHTINNLSTESQNLSAASSQITDVDMAKEMTEFTKNNILTQAAQAMLAQANQLPQGVLSLLK